MTDAPYQLAQINIAQARADMADPVMAGFVARLNDINALADAAPGFVWRLQTEAGDATALRVFDDPLLLVNMSVWQDLAALQNYVYKSMHVELLRDRDAWFHKMKPAHQALWWVPAGHIPTIAEARERLEHLRQHGPGPLAFTFAKPQLAPVEPSQA